MRGRVIYLTRTYLWTVVVFIIAKIGFMFFCREGHDFTLADVGQVISHGLSLDLSTALYFLILPFLVTIVSVWLNSGNHGDSPHVLRKLRTQGTVPMILRIYFIIIAFAFALAFVADTSLYPFWGFKLDASCLQYLSTPNEAAASVSTGYLVVRFLAIIIIAAIILWGYLRESRGQSPCTPQATHTGDSPHDSRTGDSPRDFRHRLAETVFYIFCIPLMVIGIRGGIHESTTNIGQVYYSQNQLLNHSAVNPVFSFLYSLSHTMGNLEQYQFMDDDEAQQLTENIYTTESLGSDTLLLTTQPNIVIILLEGSGEEFAHVMPYLQRLKQESICFDNCYGNSWRTDRGTVCTLSGYPSFPTLSVMKMPQKSRTLPSIARTLQEDGYHTTYLYGGDINFTNMRSYLVATGWERLISMDDFPASDRSSAQWGVRDDITFKALSELISRPSHPMLVGFSTLSSHEPWDVPQKTLDDKVLNAFSWLDNCLKDFIEPLKKTDAWKDLLIILTADHGINYRDIDLTKPMEKNHIPMLWTGGAIRAPRHITTLCNQTDLAATLLGQLRKKHDDFPFSRDVLSETYSYPTAVNNYHNAQLLIDSTGHILYDFDTKQFSIKQSPDAERLLRVNKAILQVTINDLKNR